MVEILIKRPEAQVFSSVGDGAWVPRAMRAPRWQVSRNTEGQQYRLNAYRVLLTRARAGLAIYVPRGDDDDPTRPPVEFDAIYDALVASGCAAL